MPNLRLAGDPAADALLDENPFALLVGMLLDQLTDKATGILERIVHGADDHILVESPPMVACTNPFADVHPVAHQ